MIDFDGYAEGIAAMEAYRPAYVTVPPVNAVDEAESEAERRYAACPYGDYDCAESFYGGTDYRCTECGIDHAYDEREARQNDGSW